MSALRVAVVTNMYPTREDPGFGTFVHDQVAALRQAGVHVDVLLFNGRANTWNYVWAFFRLWRLLWRERYDLIHAHFVLAGVVARAQWGHKVVLTHHGVELLGYPRWQTRLAKLITPFMDEVIYVAAHLRAALDDRDGWVIPCGIDLHQFTPVPCAEARAKLRLPSERRLVLWAGESWREEKRFYLVEQAVARVKEVLPDTELILLSQRPHEIVPTYMSACDALVLTSAAEGSPMVIKEAMACNLPIVSVRVGDVPDVIGDTPGCALADDDPVDIANKLVTILRQPRRTEGRRRIGHLRHDRIAQRLLEVYARALDSGQKARTHAATRSFEP